MSFRAEPFEEGSPEYDLLELYIMSRANGLRSRRLPSGSESAVGQWPIRGFKCVELPSGAICGVL